MTEITTHPGSCCETPKQHTRMRFAPLTWLGLSRQRRGLTRLTEHQLRDIGLTREQAEAEAQKPFWDVPLHWRN